MPYRFVLSVLLLGVCALGGGGSVFGQEPTLRPRKLVPGVLTVVPPSAEEIETFAGPLTLSDLQVNDFVPNFAPKSDTLFEKAKNVTLRHPVWTLEFAFKPLRMIEAEVPDHKTGKLRKKVVWYLLYRVRNTGEDLVPQPNFDPTDTENENQAKTFSVSPSPDLAVTPQFIPNWFCPLVVMEGWIQDGVTKEYKEMQYVDQVLPTVVPQIQAEEDPAIPLLNSVQMSEKIGLPLSPDPDTNAFWGVFTWTDLDPRIDYASIYIGGLTNAFRLTLLPDGTRKYTYKKLQLNFWRPGDHKEEVKDKVRFGVPLVTDPFEQVRLLDRFYGIAGPSFTAVEFDPQNDRPVWLFEADGIVDGELQSTVRRELIGGSFPNSLRQEFAKIGINLPGDVSLVEKLGGEKWEFQANVSGVDRHFRLIYEPRFWEMTKDGLKFRERVDHLWIYR